MQSCLPLVLNFIVKAGPFGDGNKYFGPGVQKGSNGKRKCEYNFDTITIRDNYI